MNQEKIYKKAFLFNSHESADAAYEEYPELRDDNILNDNGGEPDGNCWLIVERDFSDERFGTPIMVQEREYEENADDGEWEVVGGLPENAKWLGNQSWGLAYVVHEQHNKEKN